MRSERADVTIIGGGIIGAACAYSLCEAGLAVNLLERSFPASGTSRASDGLILLWDKSSEAELELAKISAQLWQELSERFPGRFGYAREGTILLVDTEAALPGAEATRQRLAGMGIMGEWQDGMELHALEPNLAPDLLGGVFFPLDARVDARKAALTLLDHAEKKGLRLFRNMEVMAVESAQNGAGWQVSTRESSFESDAVVCAAGVWSATICASLGIALPLRPRKGHILVTERVPGMIRHPMLEGGYSTTVHADSEQVEVAFVAEVTDEGALLIGSSRQFAGFDRSVSCEIIRKIAARALRFIPLLQQVLCIRSYAGLRPWSPDKLPLIGPVDFAPGFFLATGHEGAGIGLAPVTGKLVSDWVMGEQRSPLMDQVSPSRFFHG